LFRAEIWHFANFEVIVVICKTVAVVDNMFQFN